MNHRITTQFHKSIGSQTNRPKQLENLHLSQNVTNCSSADGEWNVSQRGVVCLSVCLLVFWVSILWRVGELDTDMVSFPLAEPGLAADSRFYLMWTSRVGLQHWLQHMISIMSRGGTHASG